MFQGVSQNTLDFISGLLWEVAFQKVTLEDLRAAINENGATDEYKNGANQFGQKVSADLSAYNNTFKHYQAAMKNLMSYLPEKNQKSKLSEFLSDEEN